MNLLQISYFLLVAETLSFKEAAEKLYVSQPAVSIQIASLEKEWGFRLFYRKYRSVALTQAGENMYKMLKQAEQNYAKALSISRSLPDTPQKLIHIGIPEWFDSLNLNDILKDYMKTHPDINIRVEVIQKDQDIFPITDTGHFDILITLDDAVKNRTDVCSLPFSRHNYGLFISKSHPLCENGHIPNLSELADFPVNIVAETFEDTVSVQYYQNLFHDAGMDQILFKGYPNAFSSVFAAKMQDGIILAENSAFAQKELAGFYVIDTNLPCNWVLAWRKNTDKEYIPDLGEAIYSETQKNQSKNS